MKLSEAVEQLIVATRAAGLSEQTATSYQRKLKPLIAFLGDRPVADITITDLRGFVSYMRNRTTRWDSHPNKRQRAGGLSEATIASTVRSVKRLFSFLTEEGVITSNPALRLKQPKPRRGEPKAASMDDLVKLLDAVAGSSRLARRNRAMVLTLADTGCRVAGLAGIRVSDVDLESGRIYVHEKGNKGRYTFITPVTRDALVDWFQVRPLDKGDYLWICLGSQGGNHLTTQGVREVLRRLKRQVGVCGPVNPHAWRHAFAREYLRNGGDLASLADYLGHSDITVTHDSYAIFLTDELKEKHSRHSPLAHWQHDCVLVAEPGSSLP